MDDSNYELARLMEYSEYRELCAMFLSLAKNDDMKEKLESILYKGTYKDYNPSGGIGRGNPFIDIERRLALAHLIVKNPDTFNELVKHNIIYFHGTNANALPGILEYGISCFDRSSKLGVDVTTGEKSTRLFQGRDFVSVTDVLGLAEEYSTLDPEKETEFSFPIVFGTTKEKLLRSRIIRVQSSIPEVGVCNFLPKDAIVCIMVPVDKIEIIKKMVGEDMLVLAINDIFERFYSAYDYNLSIDVDKYNKMKNEIFDKDDKLLGVKELVFSRNLERIKRFFNFVNGVGKDGRISK